MKSTILKWYDILSFPSEWRNEVETATDNLKNIDKAENHMEHLLKALFNCEALSKFYDDKRIDKKILLDTLSDILLWSQNHYMLTGQIGLSESWWTDIHLEGKLFRLGRLQFLFSLMRDDNARLNLKKNDPVISVHIPRGEALTSESCKESFQQAVCFFEKYFPEFQYEYFTCFSWMMDFNIKNFLNENSNIIQFQNMFDIVSYHESDSALKFLFTLNHNKSNMSSLQKKVQEHIDAGNKLYNGYGLINKNIFTSIQ